MKALTKKRTKIWLAATSSVLLAGVLAVSGIGLTFKLKKEKGNVPTAEITDKLDFAVDAYNGAPSGDKFFSAYAGRSAKTYTIDSASSFMHFIENVNDRHISYDGYTIYLNKSIDLNGYVLKSIGSEDFPFKGTFDGGYYTIYNARILGNGLFGSTDGAVIKNLGLYNAVIDSSNEITGAFVGNALNTDIENSFVRLKEINSDKKVGGLVGRYETSEAGHYIQNSFVDTEITAEEVGGLVHTIVTNDSSENEVVIRKSYYTSGAGAVCEMDNADFVLMDDSVVKVSEGVNFTEKGFEYSSNYDAGTQWCDYSYKEGSNGLDFNYPILREFVKVYMTGSYYEATVVVGNTIIDVGNLPLAVEEAGKTEAEINLLVDKIFLEARVEVDNGKSVAVNAVKPTTIVRGENNTDSMFVAAKGSKIVLGDETSELGTLSEEDAVLTIDGNREYIEKNNLESSALVVGYGGSVEINDNVILKNNINNETRYGGAVLIYGSAEDSVIGGQIDNCYADFGGGAAIIGSGDVTLGSMSNCSAIGGGAVALMGEIEDEQAVSAMAKLYGNGLTVKPVASWGSFETAFVAGEDYDSCSATTWGGAFYVRNGATITFDSTKQTSFFACYVTGSNITYGGAIYYESSQDLYIKNATFTACASYGEEATYGGAVCMWENDNYDTGDLYIQANTKFNSCSTVCWEGIGRGGAVYSDWYVYVDGASFENCESATYGGAIEASSVFLNTKSNETTTFTNNTTRGTDGQIYTIFLNLGGSAGTITFTSSENDPAVYLYSSLSWINATTSAGADISGLTVTKEGLESYNPNSNVNNSIIVNGTGLASSKYTVNYPSDWAVTYNGYSLTQGRCVTVGNCVYAVRAVKTRTGNNWTYSGAAKYDDIWRAAARYGFITFKNSSGGTLSPAISSYTATNVGTYSFKLSLGSGYYYWSDGTTTDKSLSWTINKKSVAVSWSNTSFAYDGATHIPTATANSGVSGQTIVLSVSGAQSATGTHTATATMASVTGGSTSNYTLTNTTCSYSIVDTSSYLSIDANGGSYKGASGITKVGGELGTTYSVVEPTRTGYTFNGWTTYHSENDLIIDEEVSFNGTSTYRNLGTNYHFGTITINLWAYMDDWDNYNGKRLFSCYGDYGFSAITSSSKIALQADIATSSSSVSTKTVGVPKTLSELGAGWHMFTFTYNGSKLCAYLDGDTQNYGSLSVSGSIKYTSNDVLYIGAECSSSGGITGGYYFNGKIKKLQIEQGAWDATKISTMYAAESALDAVTSSTKTFNYTFHDHDVSLNAQWLLNSYTLTVNPNGGTIGANIYNPYAKKSSSYSYVDYSVRDDGVVVYDPTSDWYDDSGDPWDLLWLNYFYADVDWADGEWDYPSDGDSYTGLKLKAWFDTSASSTNTLYLLDDRSCMDYNFTTNDGTNYPRGFLSTTISDSIYPSMTAVVYEPDDGPAYQSVVYGTVMYISAKAMSYDVRIPYGHFYSLDVPTKEGYVFAGWTVSNNSYGTVHNPGLDAYIFEQSGAGAVTITANWEEAVKVTKKETASYDYSNYTPVATIEPAKGMISWNCYLSNTAAFGFINPENGEVVNSLSNIDVPATVVLKANNAIGNYSTAVTVISAHNGQMVTTDSIDVTVNKSPISNENATVAINALGSVSVGLEGVKSGAKTLTASLALRRKGSDTVVATKDVAMTVSGTTASATWDISTYMKENADNYLVAVTISSSNTNYSAKTANTSYDDGNENATSYTVSLTKSTGISAVTGAGVYLKGETVQVSASLAYAHVFSGWTGTYTSTKASYSFTMPAQNVTLTANARLGTSTFKRAETLNDNIVRIEYKVGESGTYAELTTAGVALTASTDIYFRAVLATATGYQITFVKWNATLASGNTTSFNNKTDNPYKFNFGAIGGIYTLNATASKVANTYTIAYDGNGATGGSTASSAHTYDTAKALTANGFTKTGYSFAGWATSASGSKVYNDKASVTNLTSTNGATVTLYATWTAKNYTVTADANGGTITTSNGWSVASGSGSATKSVSYNGTYGTLPTPTRTGYTFDYWCHGELLNNYEWAVGSIASNSGDSITSQTRLRSAGYINASASTEYVIHMETSLEFQVFYLYEYTSSGTYIKGTNLSSKLTTFTTQASTAKIRLTLRYIDNTTVCTLDLLDDFNLRLLKNVKIDTSTTVNTASDHTIMAKWTANNYTVVYNGNGATSGSTASSTHAYDVSANLTTNGFSKTGYTFAGWATSESGSVVYANKAGVSNLTATKGGTVNLYAKWTAITYTIAFAGNGATSGSMSSITGVAYDAVQRLTTNAYARAYTVTYNLNYEGASTTSATSTYTFDGWKASNFTTGAVYGTTNTPSTTLESSSVLANQSYVKNLRTTSGTVTMTALWTSASVTLPTPTKEGYTFGGWYKESTLTNKVGAAGANYIPTASITLYAKWTVNTYTIKLNGNSSTSGSMSDISATYGESVTLPANGFTRDGYTFAGWTSMAQTIKTAGSGAGSDSFGTYFTKLSSDTADYSSGLYLNKVPFVADKTYTWKVDVYPVDYSIRRQYDTNASATGMSGNDECNTNIKYGGPTNIPANTWTTVYVTCTIKPGYENVKLNTGLTVPKFADGTYIRGSGKDVKIYYRNSIVYEENDAYAYYADQATVSNLTSTNGATVNLYSIWDEIPTTISTSATSASATYGYSSALNVATITAGGGGDDWTYSVSNSTNFNIVKNANGTAILKFNTGADAGTYTTTVTATSVHNGTSATTEEITVTINSIAITGSVSMYGTNVVNDDCGYLGVNIEVDQQGGDCNYEFRVDWYVNSTKSTTGGTLVQTEYGDQWGYVGDHGEFTLFWLESSHIGKYVYAVVTVTDIEGKNNYVQAEPWVVFASEEHTMFEQVGVYLDVVCYEIIAANPIDCTLTIPGCSPSEFDCASFGDGKVYRAYSTTPITITLTANKAFLILETSSDEGYVEGVNSVSIEWTPSSNTELGWAYYEIIDVTAVAGTGIASVSVDFCWGDFHVPDSESTLYAEVEEGYTFLGWFDEDGECWSEDLEFSYDFENDITLTAVATAKTYTVITQSNNTSLGVVSVNSVSNVPHFATITRSGDNIVIKDGNTVIETVSITVKNLTGYRTSLSAWKVASDLLDDGDSVTVASVIGTKNELTVQAIFSRIANVYTVTADANGGTISSSTSGWTVASDSGYATKSVTYDATYGTLPNVSRTGYVFDYWCYGELLNNYEWEVGSFNGNSGYVIDKNTRLRCEAINASPSTEYIIHMDTSLAFEVFWVYEYTSAGTYIKGTNLSTKSTTFTTQATTAKIKFTLHYSNDITVCSLDLLDDFTLRLLKNVKIDTSTAVNVASDHTIMAKWTPNQYQIIFDGNGATAYLGDADDEAKYPFYDETIQIPSNIFERKYNVTYNANGGTVTPTSETAAYTFAGWATSPNGSVVYQDGASIKNLASEDGDVVYLYAVWTPASVTLPTPTRNGYTFAGWSDGSSTYNGGSTYIPIAIVTLIAQWTTDSYRISYDLAGGSLAEGITNPSGYNVDTETFTLNNPTKPGYTFAGWSGSGLTKITEIVEIKKGSVGNRSYTANWHAKQVKVNISTPSNWAISLEGSSPSGLYSLEEGNNVVKLNATLNQPNISFNYWLKDDATYKDPYSTSRNTTYTITVEDVERAESEEGYEMLFRAIASMSYGQRAITNFSSSADSTGGQVSTQYNGSNWYETGVSGGGQISNNNPKTPALHAQAKPGYYFYGWYLRHIPTADNYTTTAIIKAEDCTYVEDASKGNYYSMQWDITQPNKFPNDNKVGSGYFYALFLPIKYNIEFVGNGATGGGMGTISNVEYNKNQQLTVNGFTRAYTVSYDVNAGSCATSSATATYTFAGWKVSNFSTGAQYGETSSLGSTVTESSMLDDQVYVKNLSTTNGADVTMTAQWDAGHVVLPTPTRIGYTFDGWYTSEDEYVGFGATNYTPTANITLHAKWAANTYTVTYNGNGNTGGSTESSIHTYDVAKNLTANGFTKTGYAFAGWATSADGEVEYADEESVTNLCESGIVLLFAKWTAVPVEIVSVDFIQTEATYGYNARFNVATITAGGGGDDWTYSVSNFTNFAVVPGAQGTASLTFKKGANAGTYTTTVTATSAYNGTSATTAEITVTIHKATLEGDVEIYGVNVEDYGEVFITVETYGKDLEYTIEWYSNSSNSMQGGTLRKTVTYLEIEGDSPSSFEFNFRPGSIDIGKYIYVVLTVEGENYETAVWKDITTDENAVFAQTGIAIYIYEAERMSSSGYLPTITIPGASTETFRLGAENTVTHAYSTSPITITLTCDDARLSLHWLGEDGEYQASSSGDNSINMSYIPSAYSEIDWVLYEYYDVKAVAGTGIKSATANEVTEGTFVEEGVWFEAEEEEGYTFLGWFDENGECWSEETCYEHYVECDITLTAMATANADTPYTVKHWLERLDGTGYDEAVEDRSTLTGTTGQPVEYSLNTYEGFEYNNEYTPEDIKGDGSTVVDLYYNRISYTLTLSKGTGIDTVTSAATSYKFGETVQVTATMSAGYVFNGWTGTFTSSTKTYSFTMPAQNVTLTANARLGTSTFKRAETLNDNIVRIEYKVGESGTYAELTTTGINATANTDYYFRAVLATATGYEITFIKWEATILYNGEYGTTSFNNTTNNPHKFNFGVLDRIYTLNALANKVANTYTIKYNRNGATSGTTASSTHTYDTAKALTANGFTKPGYEFLGWATSADGEVVYNDQESVINLTSTNGATIDLYAKWSAPDLTIDSVDLVQTEATYGYASAFIVANITLSENVDNLLITSLDVGGYFSVEKTAGSNTVVLKFNKNAPADNYAVTIMFTNKLNDNSVTSDIITVEILPAKLTGSVTIEGINVAGGGNLLTAQATPIEGAEYTYDWYTSGINSTTGGDWIGDICCFEEQIWVDNEDYMSGDIIYHFNILDFEKYREYDLGLGKYIYIVVTVEKENYETATWVDITDDATNRYAQTGVPVYIGLDEYLIETEEESFGLDAYFTNSGYVPTITIPGAYPSDTFTKTSPFETSVPYQESDSLTITISCNDDTFLTMYDLNGADYVSGYNSISLDAYCYYGIEVWWGLYELYDVTAEAGEGVEYVSVSHGPNNKATAYFCSFFEAEVEYGYEWLGWFDGDELVSEELYYEHLVTGDITLEARTVPGEVEYIVEFWFETLDGEYDLCDVDILTGTIGEMTEADAWDNAGFEAQPFEQQVIAVDTRIVIYYTRLSYNVIINTTAGFSSVIGAGTYKYEEEVTISAVVADGYTFIALESDIGDYEDETTTYTFTIPEFDIEFYYYAEPITYYIEYDGNGADGGSTSTSTHVYDAESALTANGFVKDGYNFSHWNTEPDNTGDKNYSDGELVKNLAIVPGARVTLYAQWTAGTVNYKVHHYLENIGVDGTITTSNSKLKETQTFTGVADAQVTPAVKSYEGFISPVAQTVTIYANGSLEVFYFYTRESFSLTLVAGTGVESVATSGTYDYEQEVEISVVVLAGYTWSSWSRSGSSLLEFTAVTQNQTIRMGLGDVELTANATANKYFVTLDANGGLISATEGWTLSSNKTTATKEVEFGSTYGTLPEDVRRSGYEFIGWKHNIITESDKLIENSSNYLINMYTTSEPLKSYTTYQFTITLKKATVDNYRTRIFLDGGYAAGKDVYYYGPGWQTTLSTFTTGDVSTYTHYGPSVIGVWNNTVESAAANSISISHFAVWELEGGNLTGSSEVNIAGDHTIYAAWKAVPTTISSIDLIQTEADYGYDEFNVATITAAGAEVDKWIFSVSNPEYFTLSTQDRTTEPVQLVFKAGANAGTYTTTVTARSTNNGTTATTQEITVTILPAQLEGSVELKGTVTDDVFVVLDAMWITADVTNTNNADLTYKWFVTSAPDEEGVEEQENNYITDEVFVPNFEHVGKYIYVEVTATKENYETATWTAITPTIGVGMAIFEDWIGGDSDGATITISGEYDYYPQGYGGDLYVKYTTETFVVTMEMPGYVFYSWDVGEIISDTYDALSFEWSAEMVFSTMAFEVCDITLVPGDAGIESIEMFVSSHESGMPYLGAWATIWAVVKDGYTWDGFYDSQGTLLNDVVWEEENRTCTIEYLIEGDDTITARAKANTYTIAYNGNGATGGSTASSEHAVDEAKALTANGFTRTGYTFAGWARSEAGAVVYADQEIVTNVSTVNGITVTLYAKWEAIPTTILPDGREVIELTYGQTTNVKVATYTAAGGGGKWIYTLKGTTQYFTLSETGETTGSVDVYFNVPNAPATQDGEYPYIFWVNATSVYTGETVTPTDSSVVRIVKAQLAPGTVTITGRNSYDPNVFLTDTLKAEVSGAPEGATLTYEWYYNDVNSTEGGTYFETYCVEDGALNMDSLVPSEVVGKYIYVKVIASKGRNYEEAVWYDITDAENNTFARTALNVTVMTLEGYEHITSQEGTVVEQGWPAAVFVPYEMLPVTITAHAEGYYIYDENTMEGALNSYSFECTSIEDSFFEIYSIKVYNVEAIAGEHIASVTVTHTHDSGYALENYESIFTAVVEDGYEFSGWFNGDEFVSSDLEYTISIEQDITLTAKVKEAINGGSVIITDINTYDPNAYASPLLTAEVSGVPEDAVLTYKWYYNDTNSTVGGTLFNDWSSGIDMAAVPMEVVGKYIYVEVCLDETDYKYASNGPLCSDITDAENNMFARTGIMATIQDNGYGYGFDSVTAPGCEVIMWSSNWWWSVYIAHDNLPVTITAYKQGHYLYDWLTGEGALNEYSVECTSVYNAYFDIAAMLAYNVQAVAGKGIASATVTFTHDIIPNAPSDVAFEEGNAYFSATTKPGYTWLGWFDENGELFSSDLSFNLNDMGIYIYEDMTFTAMAEPMSGIEYTVKHWLENVDGTYEEVELDRVTLTGTTGELTNAEAKVYENYQVQEFAQLEIEGDGSTVINIYYNRKMFTVMLNYQNGVTDVSGAGEFKFGASVTVIATLQSGYVFVGWEGTLTSSLQEFTFTMPANNVELTAIAKPDIVQYIVKHNLQKLDGTGYVVADTETLTGKTDASTEAEANEYAGFAAQSFEQAVIAADGSTVINIYYTRNSYTVTLSRELGISAVTGAGEYKFGESVTVTATSANGYDFAGWEGTFNSSSATYTFTMPAGSVELTAKAKTISYTITYNLDNGTAVGNPTTYTIETASFTLINPTRSGYTFLGWIGTDADTMSTTVTITQGSTGNREFTAIWGASIVVETTGASGKTYEVQVYEGDKLVEAYTSTFILQTRKTYTIKVAVSNLVANSTTNEYEIVRMANVGGLSYTVDSFGATTFSRELLKSVELLESKTISIEYIDAYKLTVTQPANSIVGFAMAEVDNKENVIINYSNEYIIANNTSVEFTIDSTPINLKAAYTYTGFKYNAGNGEVVVAENGDDIVVHQVEKFEVNTTLGDRNIGVRTFKVKAGTKLQSIVLTAVQSVVIDLSTIIEGGTVQLRDNTTGFIKIIDISTTKIVLYAGTWEITENSANLSVAQLQKLFEGYSVSADGKTLTIS